MIEVSLKLINMCKKLGISSYFCWERGDEKMTLTELARLCGTSRSNLGHLLRRVNEGKARGEILRAFKGRLNKAELDTLYRKGIAFDICAACILHFSDKNEQAGKTVLEFKKVGIDLRHNIPPLVFDFNKVTVSELADLCGVTPANIHNLFFLLRKGKIPIGFQMPQMFVLDLRQNTARTLDPQLCKAVIFHYAQLGYPTAKETITRLIEYGVEFPPVAEGMSIGSLARACQVSKAFVSRVVNGKPPKALNHLEIKYRQVGKQIIVDDSFCRQMIEYYQIKNKRTLIDNS